MKIIKIPNLLDIKHGVITQSNVSFKVDDNAKDVMSNRVKISQEIGNEIIMLNQEHRNTIIEVTSKNKDLLLRGYKNIEYTNGDGLFTKLDNVILSMISADCAIVFLYAPDIKAIGIIHSGWKGSLSDLNENMIEKFILEKADLSKIIMAIGPAIACKSYEIGNEFYENFVKHDPLSANFFIDKKYYDNIGYIANKYQKYGIKNIYISPEDTYTNESLFSYRYYQHFGKKNGRMMGFISL